MVNKRLNISKEDVINDYMSGRSLRDVAHKHNVSAATIMRIVRKANELRGKDEAQKLALENGTSIHPTKGQTRSEDVKNKISSSLAENWEAMSEDERERRAKDAQDRWNQMSPEKRREFTEKATKAIRKAADYGSKLELFLQDFLKTSGFHVISHKKELIPNTKLEVDILVPELKTVIEIDGPSHYSPVWGADALQKTIKADSEKNGLLLMYGYHVIRLRYDGSNFTRHLKNNVKQKILEVLNSIKNKTAVEKLIKLEV